MLVSAISDERIKTHAKNLKLSLNITKLRLSYNYKNKYGNGLNSRIGLIAQEVRHVFPSICNYSHRVIDDADMNLTKMIFKKKR